MILYPFIVEFPRVSWDIQHQYRKTADRLGVEEYIVREGVPFVRPHPSRVAWDNSSALSEINTDTGPDWIMYWDVVRYGSIAKNTDYWNRSSISYTNSFHKELNLLGLPYFNIYYETDHPCTARDPFPLSEADPAQENDRAANVGLYSAEKEGEPVVITEYRKKLIPKDYGIGEYPYYQFYILSHLRQALHREVASLEALLGHALHPILGQARKGVESVYTAIRAQGREPIYRFAGGYAELQHRAVSDRYGFRGLFMDILYGPHFL